MITLSDRIKEFYEDRTKVFLPRRTITLLRLDGKGFSKFTKNLNKPFDDEFSEDMDITASYLCENIQGAKFAYTQSDEITVVMTDFDTLETDAWFDYNVQKMVSISASLATAKFNERRMFRYFNYSSSGRNISEHFAENTDFEIVRDDIASFINYMPLGKSILPCFDSRVFQVPSVDELVNAIIQRQQDCTRNSVSMAASANYSHKELEGKTSDEKQEMLFQKGINWNDYKTKYKRGTIIKKVQYEVLAPNGETVLRNRWTPVETPIISQDKAFISSLIPTV